MQLSHQEYNALWRRLRLGDKHLMLYIRDHGATLTTLLRGGMVRRAVIGAAARNRIGSRERLTSEVEALVRSAAGPVAPSR